MLHSYYRYYFLIIAANTTQLPGADIDAESHDYHQSPTNRQHLGLHHLPRPLSLLSSSSLMLSAPRHCWSRCFCSSIPDIELCRSAMRYFSSLFSKAPARPHTLVRLLHLRPQLLRASSSSSSLSPCLLPPASRPRLQLAYLLPSRPRVSGMQPQPASYRLRQSARVRQVQPPDDCRNDISFCIIIIFCFLLGFSFFIKKRDGSSSPKTKKISQNPPKI